jgi:hypothetical protein
MLLLTEEQKKKPRMKTNTNKIITICAFLLFPLKLLSQQQAKLYFEIKDTIMLSKPNSITYYNQSSDSIYVNTTIYNSQTHEPIIKNLFNKKPTKSYSLVKVLQKVLPNSSSAYEILPVKFIDYKVRKGKYLFKTTFYHKKSGNIEQIKESEKYVLIR